MEICTNLGHGGRVGKSESEDVLRINDNNMYILFLRDNDGKNWQERAACLLSYIPGSTSQLRICLEFL